MKLLFADEGVHKELFLTSHGISPVRSVTGSSKVRSWLDNGIPGGTDFSHDVLEDIMETAVIAPRFDSYNQVMMMVENAVSDELNGETQQRNQLLSAQREINIYLSQH